MPTPPSNPQPRPYDVARYAEPVQLGVDADGRPVYGWPREQPPTVVHHHHAAPARRAPQPGEVLGWLGVAGAVAAVLLAVAVSAVAVALASLAITILALVLRGLWKDIRGKG